MFPIRVAGFNPSSGGQTARIRSDCFDALIVCLMCFDVGWRYVDVLALAESGPATTCRAYAAKQQRERFGE